MVQTDYKPVTTILLSYPERFYNGYDELVPFYDELIALIPNNFTIWIITNNNQTIKKLEEKFKHKKIHFLGLKGWDEIWLRDCIGLNTSEHIIKPKYNPAYCIGSNDYDYFKKINGLTKTIVKECLKKDVKELDLVIDGGNFICNDTHVYLTDKVYDQNEIYSKNEIDEKIKVATGLIPVIIKGNRGDAIGHIDAYLSFIDNKTAIIPSYPSFPFLKDDIDFIDQLERTLRINDVKRITLHDRPIDEIANCGCNKKGKPCFYSARGNFINFLQLNNTIILPEYNLPTKKETEYYNKTNQEILEGLGFDVLRINCDQLAKFGGVLHCISYTF
jgi:agmatine/peptidylarginine deiminase